MKIKTFFQNIGKKIANFYGKDKKKSIILGSAVLIFIVLLTIFLTTRGNGQDDTAVQAEIVTLTSGTFSQTIDVVGTVRAVPSATLTTETSGIVSPLNISVGDSVKQGDVLLSLDASSLPSSVLQAQSDLLDAQYELDKLKVADSLLQEAALALDDAEYDYAAKKQMRDYWNFNNTSDERIDSARAAYQQSEEDLWNAQHAYEALSDLADDNAEKIAADEAVDAARLARDKAYRNINYLLGRTYDHTVETDFIEFDQADAALEEARVTYEKYKDNSEEIAAAQANVQALQNTVNSAYVIAPFGGIVTDILVDEGDIVSDGTQAVQLDDLTNLVIDISVSEIDINEIEIGQSVNIIFDAIPNKEYEGAVSKVSQAGDDSSGTVEFTVTISITNADEEIKPGFTAVATVMINEVENAVLVPNLAIQTMDGSSVVMVVDSENNITTVPVEVEASSDSYSIVKDGALQVGDQVMVFVNASTSDTTLGMFGLGGMMGGGMGGNEQPAGEPPQGNQQQ
ncbi:MAG: efflux RND transporter periplasmic adaptor subunit [Anaerolineaceae bacterium]